jgi:hypothetical protein
MVTTVAAGIAAVARGANDRKVIWKLSSAQADPTAPKAARRPI